MSIFHDKMNLLPPRPTSTRSYSVWDKRQSRSSLSTAVRNLRFVYACGGDEYRKVKGLKENTILLAKGSPPARTKIYV